MFSFANVILFITVLFSGLIAGLFYSYSCSVNIGLKALPNEAYLKAMQSINSAIQNPYFFMCFIGLLFVFPLSCWTLYSQQPKISFYLFVFAGLFYFLGVFSVTVFGNVPLNNQLAQFNIESASPAEILKMRFTFENSWNKFHLIRTIFSLLSFSLTILATLKYKF